MFWKKNTTTAAVAEESATDSVLVVEFAHMDNALTAYYGDHPNFSAIELRLFCISAMVVLIIMAMVRDKMAMQAEIDTFVKYGTFGLYQAAGMDVGDDGTKLLQLESAFKQRHSVYGQRVFQFVKENSAEAGLELIAEIDSRVIPDNHRDIFATTPAFYELSRILAACANSLQEAYR